MNTSSPAASCRIFISYRHDEDGMAAGWLVERLAGHFGKDQVFKDVDSIQPGDDFVKVIADAVGRCDVLLALIGRHWLTITGDDGRRRLDNPQDFVRLEIEAALKRDVRLIPVLIEGTPMPRADEVPPGLAALVNRQALDFSSAHAEPEFDRLIKALNRTLAEVRARPAATEPEGNTTTVPAEHDVDTHRKSDPAEATGNATRTSELPGKASAAYATLHRRSGEAARKWAPKAKKPPTGKPPRTPVTGDQPPQVKRTRIRAPAVDVPALAEALCRWYEAQHLEAAARPATPTGLIVQCRTRRTLERASGMGAALTVILRREGEDLLVEIGAAKWLGKRVGTGAGLLFHWALVPVGIGVWRQYKLPRQTIEFLRTEAPRHLRSTHGAQSPPPDPHDVGESGDRQPDR
jgi:hypothetical protein